MKYLFFISFVVFKKFCYANGFNEDNENFNRKKR